MPALVADVADDQALRDQLLQGIDTQLQATLPLEYHAAQLLQRHLQIGSRRDPAFPIPLPPNKPSDEASTEEWDTYRRKLKEEWEPEFQHHALMVVSSRHFHTHQGTCLLGKRGNTGCRMCAPWPHDIDDTRLVQLHLLAGNNNAAGAMPLPPPTSFPASLVQTCLNFFRF